MRTKIMNFLIDKWDILTVLGFLIVAFIGCWLYSSPIISRQIWSVIIWVGWIIFVTITYLPMMFKKDYKNRWKV